MAIAVRRAQTTWEGPLASPGLRWGSSYCVLGGSAG
jgi:hypothetical protein